MQGYNFTERVRRVLMVAREEADALHHEYVGTEHILLGLLGDDGGVATATIRSFDIDGSTLRDRVLETVRPGKAEYRGPDLPYTSRAKKVLELAISEARQLGHSYVGTEHLLLGLLIEGRGIAAQVLAAAGMDVGRTRAEIVRQLGPDAPAEDGDQRRVVRRDDRETQITIVVERGDGRLEAMKFKSSRDAVQYIAQLEI